MSCSYIQRAARQADITAQNLRANQPQDEADASGGDPLSYHCAELDAAEPGESAGPQALQNGPFGWAGRHG
jgi:hypothetical protein